jgi:hypothetical protein
MKEEEEEEEEEKEECAGEGEVFGSDEDDALLTGHPSAESTYILTYPPTETSKPKSKSISKRTVKEGVVVGLGRVKAGSYRDGESMPTIILQRAERPLLTPNAEPAPRSQT